MADEPIRSQLPNDNYRKGWDETFGKKLTPSKDRYLLIRPSRHNIAAAKREGWKLVKHG